MKVRCGFVSNSSSSSFFIYGGSIESSTAEEIFLKAGVDEEQFVDGVMEFLYGRLNDCDLEINGDYEDYYMHIGITPSKIKDDETGAEFKARVKALLTENLPEIADELAMGYHEDCWRDG